MIDFLNFRTLQNLLKIRRKGFNFLSSYGDTILKKIMLLLTATFLLVGCGEETKNQEKLYVYNWTEYIPNSLIQEFEKETGIDVEYRTFESNEQMYSKLKLTEGTNQKYDVVFPSNYYITKMAQEGMLSELDHSKLSNFKYITKELLNKPFDPNNKYSLPYIYGITGLAVDAGLIDPAKITSWSDLWNEEYKGMIQLMNDSREVFHVALLLNGKNPNSKNEEDIKGAFEKLQKLVPNVKSYNSDAPEVPFLNGDVALGMMWNGSGYLGSQSNKNIKFIYPKEGVIIWIDNYAIPKNAQNKEAAYKFIDFLLRPESAKKVLTELGYSMPNDGVFDLIDEKTRQNKVLFPPKEELRKGVAQEDVGDAIDIYEKYWQLLRVQ